MKLKLLKEGMTPSVDATEYRSLTGSLRYLCNSRPDLAYAVGYLSRFMEAPREEHLAAVKWVLHYIAGTVHWGCTIIQEEEMKEFPSCWATRIVILPKMSMIGRAPVASSSSLQMGQLPSNRPSRRWSHCLPARQNTLQGQRRPVKVFGWRSYLPS